MRFLFVDRILQLSPGGVVRGIKHVTHEDPYLCHDEHGRPCFIPSLIGESLGQLAAWNVMVSNDFSRRPVAGIVAKACLFRPAYVGETLLLESFIDCLDDSAVEYHSIARINEEIIFTVDGALGPLLPMNDFIDPAVVRRQFVEINQPGDWPPADCVNRLGSYDERTNQLCSLKIMPLFFDRILTIEPGLNLSAEKRITRAAPYFPDHFPNKPVLPMTVLLECQLNLAREFILKSNFQKPYKLCEMRKIKMNEFIQPGDVVLCYLTVKQHNENELVLNFRSEVSGKRVCVLDVVMR